MIMFFFLKNFQIYRHNSSIKKRTGTQTSGAGLKKDDIKYVSVINHSSVFIKLIQHGLKNVTATVA
jgi:hypothetical protein